MVSGIIDSQVSVKWGALLTDHIWGLGKDNMIFGKAFPIESMTTMLTKVLVFALPS